MRMWARGPVLVCWCFLAELWLPLQATMIPARTTTPSFITPSPWTQPRCTGISARHNKVPRITTPSVPFRPPFATFDNEPGFDTEIQERAPLSWRVLRSFATNIVLGLLWRVPVLAAVTGGRISGRSRDSPPSRAPAEQHRSIPSSRSSVDNSDYWHYWGSSSMAGTSTSRGTRRVRFVDLDTQPDEMATARVVGKKDLAVVGSVVGLGVAQHQYRRHKEREHLAESTALHNLQIQVALSGTHFLRTLRALADNAQLNTAQGLSSLASALCIELLRNEGSWVAGYVRSKQFFNPLEAEKDFNELAVRESKKWNYDTTSRRHTDYKTVKKPVSGLHNANNYPTYLVVTLLVTCTKEGLGQVPKTVGSVGSLERLLESFAASIVGGGGRAVAVDIKWTPDDDNDNVTEEEILQKWPELSFL